MKRNKSVQYTGLFQHERNYGFIKFSVYRISTEDTGMLDEVTD